MLSWIRNLLSTEGEVESLLARADRVTSVDEKAEIYGELASEGVRQALEGIAMLAYKNRRWAAQNSKQIEVWLRKGTKKDIPWCQLVLGWMYEEGLGVSKDPDEALFRYEQTARMDLEDGFFRLGLLSLRGTLGTHRDPYKAALYFYQAEQMGHEEARAYLNAMVDWEIVRREDLDGKLERLLEHELSSQGSPWRNGVPADEDMPIEGIHFPKDGFDPYESKDAVLKRAMDGDGRSICRLGVMYLFGEGGMEVDIEKAIESFKNASKLGVVEAQTNLAALYMTGEGLAQNFDKARELLTDAANQSDGFAMCKLGDIYAEGLGVPMDSARAVFWYQKAVEHGDLRAAVALGLRYWEGRGIKANQNRAMILFKMAAAKGDTEGMSLLARALLDQPDPEKHKDAIGWLKELARRRHGLSMFLLGRCYEKGRGVAKDEKEAITWYQFAARRDLFEAKLVMGKLLAQGKVKAGTPEEEVIWLREAALEGNLLACYRLGTHYINGTSGVDPDEKEAIRLFTRAAEGSLPEAQMALCILYDQGRGVEIDKEKSHYWLKKAVENGNPEASYRYGLELISSGRRDEGIQNLTYAADQKYPLAADKLGDIFRDTGKIEKARFWYEQALEYGDIAAKEKLDHLKEMA